MYAIRSYYEGLVEGLFAFGGQRDSFGACVGFRSGALDQAAGFHTGDHVSQRGAVDAGGVDQVRLAGAVIAVERGEQRELAQRDASRAERLGAVVCIV